ncbi:TOMM precursor leader peptide-binding protein [Streptomyces sp. NPDC059477]|uniref:TOMM precursor leader peptide-binding protein n=1 Tax=Streptomyces sp. NPDC059477 TaxID=3346847 RepID=UPI0036B51780
MPPRPHPVPHPDPDPVRTGTTDTTGTTALTGTTSTTGTNTTGMTDAPAAPDMDDCGTAAALSAVLAPLGVPVLDARAALASTGGPAVVLLEEWTLGLAEELSRHALGHPVVHVPVRFDGALTVVGPALRPGAAACLCCTEHQRLATTGGRVPWQSPRMGLAGLAAPALAEAVGALAADLLAEEPGAADAGATVRTVHHARATWSTHRVRPVGGCAVCAPLPPDNAPDARLPSVPRPLPDPSVLRGPNPRTDTAGLRAALHDERFGPVRRIIRSEDSVFGLTTAYVTDGRLVDDGGYGRATDYDSSERVALFESVERFAGMRPTGRRTVLRASFASLGGERAVDPERLGLPDPAFHGHPASRTVPYTPQLELDWVHGWSLTHGRPVAVPEHVAYWDVPGTDRPRVVYESSNGCGLGNSPQEAALYGLFEVAERDAFLMAWYAATPLHRIALPADDPDVAHLADRAALAGYGLTLLDATNDFAVPAVIAVCRYRGTHPAAPRAFLAAGAHHDPRTAIRSAVAEVVTNVHESAHRAVADGHPRDPELLRPMLERPELVLSLDDHVGLNTLPEAQSRLDFLFADTRELDLRDLWPGAPEPVTDLTELLDRTVRRLSGEGLEVIVVGQDEPGLRERLGLHCAKAVVPGSLPMTFGHVNHRTRGLPRLLEVPYRLGRTPRPLRYDELALHPHPFP